MTATEQSDKILSVMVAAEDAAYLRMGARDRGQGFAEYTRAILAGKQTAVATRNFIPDRPMTLSLVLPLTAAEFARLAGEADAHGFTVTEFVLAVLRGLIKPRRG